MATLTPLPLPLSFEDFCALFLLFIAYSTLGWCGEMIYCSVPKGRLCEKRGFLNGFLCPIYGHGALLVLYALFDLPVRCAAHKRAGILHQLGDGKALPHALVGLLPL